MTAGCKHLSSARGPITPCLLKPTAFAPLILRRPTTPHAAACSSIAQGLRAYDLGIGSTIPLLFFPIFGVMIYFLTKRLLNNEEV